MTDLYSPSPLLDGCFSRDHVVGLSQLMLLVNDLDYDEAEAADDTEADEDEDAPHVLEAERRGRVVVVVAAVDLVVQKDPRVVEVLHLPALKQNQTILIQLFQIGPNL